VWVYIETELARRQTSKLFIPYEIHDLVRKYSGQFFVASVPKLILSTYSIFRPILLLNRQKQYVFRPNARQQQNLCTCSYSSCTIRDTCCGYRGFLRGCFSSWSKSCGVGRSSIQRALTGCTFQGCCFIRQSIAHCRPTWCSLLHASLPCGRPTCRRLVIVIDVLAADADVVVVNDNSDDDDDVEHDSADRRSTSTRCRPIIDNDSLVETIRYLFCCRTLILSTLCINCNFSY